VTDETVRRQTRRIQHFVTEDPGGSWVAEADGRVVGAALASVRDSLWGLSLLAVHPDCQSTGIGRLLLDATLQYGEHCSTGIIVSSRDPRAIRRYALAGFELFPQVRAAGTPDASALPESPRVRAGSADDAAFADRIDSRVRGAARRDHAYLASFLPMFVADAGEGGGYAYARADAGVMTVSATDESVAVELLSHCLREDAERERTGSVEHIAANQQWAIRTVLRAGLSIEPAGPVFWRGRTPPDLHLPSGPYL
jgi:GNAT superfamily N-acetyltransferase